MSDKKEPPGKPYGCDKYGESGEGKKYQSAIPAYFALSQKFGF
jgi:hypothetical protein